MMMLKLLLLKIWIVQKLGRSQGRTRVVDSTLSTANPKVLPWLNKSPLGVRAVGSSKPCQRDSPNRSTDCSTQKVFWVILSDSEPKDNLDIFRSSNCFLRGWNYSKIFKNNLPWKNVGFNWLKYLRLKFLPEKTFPRSARWVFHPWIHLHEGEGGEYQAYLGSEVVIGAIKKMQKKKVTSWQSKSTGGLDGLDVLVCGVASTPEVWDDIKLVDATIVKELLRDKYPDSGNVTPLISNLARFEIAQQSTHFSNQNVPAVDDEQDARFSCGHQHGGRAEQQGEACAAWEAPNLWAWKGLCWRNEPSTCDQIKVKPKSMHSVQLCAWSEYILCLIAKSLPEPFLAIWNHNLSKFVISKLHVSPKVLTSQCLHQVCARDNWTKHIMYSTSMGYFRWRVNMWLIQ